MILLIVQSHEFSVQEIMRWLNYLKKEYIVINELNYIVDINLLMDGDITLKLKGGDVFSFSEVQSVFIRRGRFWFQNNLPYNLNGINSNKNTLNILETKLNNFVKTELEALEEYLMKKIKENTFYIGDFKEGNINKLIALETAQKVGLKTPKTIINSNSKRLDSNELITKAIKEGFVFNIDNELLKLMTHLVDKRKMPKKYAPTLFQQRIHKKFELRVFYCKGLFYTMAIFSQNNSKTNIDFRNYDYKQPNRLSPYKLPLEIENKLKTMMNSLNLSTGSIDMIYSQENEYIFLEVNPTGQFGMVSSPCNYFIEKKIAELL